MSNPATIQALVNLFNPKKDENADSDEEISSELRPNEETKADSESKINPYEKLKEVERVENLDYTACSESEASTTDWKKTPKWDLSYRQKVTSEDIFLQMGSKSPATSSCEDMIITIAMPGDRMQNMDIKLLEKSLTVDSPQYFLKLDLPQPVEPKKGNAKWDKDTEKLTITLRMDREFDYINF